MRKHINTILWALVVVVAFAFVATMAHAHKNTTSPTDLCHKDGRTGERHRHIPGTDDPGWTCGKKGSGLFQAIPGSGATGYVIKDMGKPAVLKPKGPTKAEMRQRMQELEADLHAAAVAANNTAAKHSREVRGLRNQIAVAKTMQREAKRLEGVAMRKLRAVVNESPVCVRERGALTVKVNSNAWNARGWREEAKRLEECLAAGE